MATVQLWQGSGRHPRRKGPCNQRWNCSQTKGRVKSLCRAADGLGRRRAGPDRWHSYQAGMIHWALLLVHVGALQRPGAAEPGTPAAWGVWGGGGPVMAQRRMCCPSRKKQQATWGCYVKKQALPLAKLGLARAGRKRLMGSCPSHPKPLETDLGPKSTLPSPWEERGEGGLVL